MNRRFALDTCWKSCVAFAGAIAALALTAPRADAFYYFRWRVVVHRHRRRFRRWRRR